jgi:glycosyltransferase involved in cell wall biosynthesis
MAIVHPWYLANGGAEQTVNALAEVFPRADFFALFYRQQDLPRNLKGRKITALGMNWIPAKYHVYRHLLPLYPLLFESLDLRGYDLIITSDSCVAKGILVDQNSLHVCYCHSPMRCLWDQHREYSEQMPIFAKPAFSLATHYVRQWDMSAAQRVDAFVANSYNVAERIRTYYRRESTVIYPPVDTERGYIADRHEDYYFSAGRLVDVKKLDLLIRACNRLRRRFIIAGSGREERRLKAISGPTIEFVGHVSSGELARLYAGCRAFLFAAEEDFGIVPVEAQSYGRPVIAYGRGGALETVIPLHNPRGLDATGIFFDNQTVESVEGAILQFERSEEKFSPVCIQNHANNFNSRIFSESIQSVIEASLGRRAKSTTASRGRTLALQATL